MQQATSEITWLVNLLEELNVTTLKPVTLHCDNQSAIQIAKNPVYHERTKHIEIDCHFTREKLMEGLIQLTYLPTQNQLVDVLTKMESEFALIVSMLAICIATLATNIAANVVSPANDFANVAPKTISFRVGGMITAFIGVLMMPWQLLASSGGYIFVWLAGYSALLGPIAGILIADYWLIRRTRLAVDDLYREHGSYTYRRGWNPAALVAFAAGVLPNLPGFLKTAAPEAFGWIGPGWAAAYHWAWFIGLFVALAVYAGLMRMTNYGASQQPEGIVMIPTRSS